MRKASPRRKMGRIDEFIAGGLVGRTVYSGRHAGVPILYSASARNCEHGLAGVGHISPRGSLVSFAAAPNSAHFSRARAELLDNGTAPSLHLTFRTLSLSGSFNPRILANIAAARQPSKPLIKRARAACTISVRSLTSSSLVRRPFRLMFIPRGSMFSCR
jgi:hypothetical protein